MLLNFSSFNLLITLYVIINNQKILSSHMSYRKPTSPAAVALANLLTWAGKSTAAAAETCPTSQTRQTSRTCQTGQTKMATSDTNPVQDMDGQPRHSSHLVTPFSKVRDLKPLPGDLIEFSRDLYSHWALYVGEGKVVNVRGGQPRPSDVSFTGDAYVRMERLEDVAGVSPCRINNQEGEATSRGLQTLHVGELMEKAKALVGTTVPYNLFTRNCEHYVTEWRYGKPWSEQVEAGQRQFGDLAGLAKQKDLPELLGMLGSFMSNRR